MVSQIYVHGKGDGGKDSSSIVLMQLQPLSDTLKQLDRIKDVSWNRFASYEEFEKSSQSLSLLTPKLALFREGAGFEWAGDLDYEKAEAHYRYMNLGVITLDTQRFFYPDRNRKEPKHVHA